MMLKLNTRPQQKNKQVSASEIRITLTCEPHGHLFFSSSAMLIPDQALIQVERSPDYAS